MSWCGHGKRFACTRAMPIAVKTSSREIHQNIIREFTSSNVYCIFILTEVHTMYSVQGDKRFVPPWPCHGNGDSVRARIFERIGKRGLAHSYWLHIDL